MNIFELLKSEVSINDTIINQFDDSISKELPELVKKLLCSEPGFYDTERMYRLLDTEEVLSMSSTELLLLFDIQDNYFICYHIQSKKYVIFYAIDKTYFNYKGVESLEDLIAFLEYFPNLMLAAADYLAEFDDYTGNNPEISDKRSISIEDVCLMRYLTNDEQEEHHVELIVYSNDISNELAEKDGIKKYDKDFYSNGILVRKAGHRADMLHIIPIWAGGENTLDNLIFSPTNKSVDEDKDKQFIEKRVAFYNALYELTNNKQ